MIKIIVQIKVFVSVLVVVLAVTVFANSATAKEQRQPNILFCISDDQSYAHTGFAGCQFVKTPAFDKLAAGGVYFTHCYAGSPGCAPSRSSLVTGRYHWQNEQSGQHSSGWLKKYVPFIDLLDNNGYFTGCTGKGVGPFEYAEKGDADSLFRIEDAGGVMHSDINYSKNGESDQYGDGIKSYNYFENFKFFMNKKEADKPFFFWYGCKEPHRSYEKDSWVRHGKKLSDVTVPAFLPDNETVRGDLLDYAVEIDWFDLHLSRMVAYLEEIGELDNTIIIVTADNGMPFPRAKANAYEYGVHVPLVVYYPKAFPGKRVVDDMVSFVDMAPTVLELTGTSNDGMLPMAGKSITKILTSNKQGIVNKDKAYVYAGRERHSSSRYENWGYPQRVIHSQDHLLIWNAKYDRWPAGAPQSLKEEGSSVLRPMYGIDEAGVHHKDWAFTDVDGSPTKSIIIERHGQSEMKPFFELSFGKRPEYELFDLNKDPYCVNNIASDQSYDKTFKTLKRALRAELTASKDPRVTGPDKEVFDSYKRYSSMRYFPKP
ncbi:MAG: sulfatase [Blastopirellula sp.]|nr:MAG: sulfatase [Blastopirellula sp.]